MKQKNCPKCGHPMIGMTLRGWKCLKCGNKIE